MALPREVRQQWQVGDGIDRVDVRPGDLVFFETVWRGASHVGIALGDGSSMPRVQMALYASSAIRRAIGRTGGLARGGSPSSAAWAAPRLLGE
jgi:cell wall-associated NlpC family hydrolase